MSISLLLPLLLLLLSSFFTRSTNLAVPQELKNLSQNIITYNTSAISPSSSLVVSFSISPSPTPTTLPVNPPLVPAFFVFGDSSVDCGTNNYLGTLARADHSPYGRDFDTHKPTGRFCNGRIPVDYLGKHLVFNLHKKKRNLGSCLIILLWMSFSVKRRLQFRCLFCISWWFQLLSVCYLGYFCFGDFACSSAWYPRKWGKLSRKWGHWSVLCLFIYWFGRDGDINWIQILRYCHLFFVLWSITLGTVSEQVKRALTPEFSYLFLPAKQIFRLCC